jgi:hypothetical protein
MDDKPEDPPISQWPDAKKKVDPDDTKTATAGEG